MGAALGLCMSEKQVIDAKIAAAASRRKLQLGWRNMWLGLLIGVCLWLGALVVFTGVPLWGAVIHQAFGALLFAVLTTAFLRPFAKQRSRFGND